MGPRTLAAISTVAAIAATAACWGSAAAHGGAPARTAFRSNGPSTSWRLTGSDAETRRLDILRRAAVRLPPASAPVRPPQPASADLACRFLAGVPDGTSAKFDCVLEDGTVVKVKYGRNPEIHAEAAATRLLARLGYPADLVTLVPRLRCYGCPRYPFFAMRLLTLAGAASRLTPHGYADGFSDFAWVAVERRFPAAAIETPVQEGWAFFELAQSHAPPADLDALRLLAVFLAHWDNKAENQRLVCLDAPGPAAGRDCATPLLMIQDLGATFGPTKVSLAPWSLRPVWRDRATCLVSMRDMPFDGGTFADTRISEAGRQTLGRALASLTADEVRGLFRDARFPEFHTATDDTRDLARWVDAFDHRVRQIVDGPPCPG